MHQEGKAPIGPSVPPLCLWDLGKERHTLAEPRRPPTGPWGGSRAMLCVNALCGTQSESEGAFSTPQLLNVP